MADEGVLALFTELPAEIIQVQRPDKERVVFFYIVDLRR